MVNQADGYGSAIYCDTAHHTFSIIPTADISQRLSVYDTEILHLKALYSINLFYYIIMRLGNTLVQVLAFGQYAVNMRRQKSLIIAQKRISATAGKSAFLADYRTRDNLDIPFEIFNHPLYDANLLVILLTKVGTVWFYIAEKFAHNLTYTVKMAGAECTFHYAVRRRITKNSGIGFGIYFLNRRSENHLCAALFKQTAIGLKRARIPFQVFLVIKLGWVQEYAHNRNVVLLYTTVYQRRMTGMQSTHRGHQSDAMPLHPFIVQTCF